MILEVLFGKGAERYQEPQKQPGQQTAKENKYEMGSAGGSWLASTEVCKN